MKLSSPKWLSFFCVIILTAISVPVFADPPADVHAESEVNPKPELKKPVKVRFPSSLKKKIGTGEIVLQFIVTKVGKVSDISVVKFSDSDMVEPAVTAYEGAQYNPGMLKGIAVDVRVDVTIPFPSK